jgi:hypothetical protein
MLLSHLDGRKHKEWLVGLDEQGRHIGNLSINPDARK